jgi:hypothetical protein
MMKPSTQGLAWATTLAGFGVALALACTGTTEARVPKDGSGLGAPEIPWADKTGEERMAFMAAHFQPAMEKLFRAHDADSFPELPCAACHGPNMEAEGYAMPADIYPLPDDDPIGEAQSYDEDIAEFMVAEVVPAVEHLFGIQGAAKGESCFLCHPKE